MNPSTRQCSSYRVSTAETAVVLHNRALNTAAAATHLDASECNLRAHVAARCHRNRLAPPAAAAQLARHNVSRRCAAAAPCQQTATNLCGIQA